MDERAVKKGKKGSPSSTSLSLPLSLPQSLLLSLPQSATSARPNSAAEGISLKRKRKGKYSPHTHLYIYEEHPNIYGNIGRLNPILIMLLDTVNNCTFLLTTIF